MQEIGTPEFVDDVSTEALATMLFRVAESEATGVLFAEGPARSPSTGSAPPAGRRGSEAPKNLYFLNGKLHHVASNDAGELLGEYLVRRKIIWREELDFALTVLPRSAGEWATR